MSAMPPKAEIAQGMRGFATGCAPSGKGYGLGRSVKAGDDNRLA
jgi:hypothetical protein